MSIYEKRNTQALAARIEVHSKALEPLLLKLRWDEIAAELAYRDHMLDELTKLYWEMRETQDPPPVANIFTDRALTWVAFILIGLATAIGLDMYFLWRY